MAEVLVVGATGFLGGEIARRLLEKGTSVRCLVRREEDAGPLRQAGAEIAIGDLKDPSTLSKACADVTAVVSTATTTRSRREGDDLETVDLNGQLSLVGAARQAGMRRYLFISYSKNVTGPDPLTNAKRTVENAIIDSGLTYTILRPACFMEVWLGPRVGFDFPNAKATIFGSGEKRLSWISIGDVARYAVDALSTTAAENEVIELGGPEALSPKEVVRIFEEVGGRPFELQFVPEEAIRQQRDGSTDMFEKTFASLMLAVASGDVVDTSRARRILPGSLTSVRAYAERAVGAQAVAS